MRKYVVHAQTFGEYGYEKTMFMIEKDSDEAAIRFVLDVDTPTCTEEDFMKLIMDWRDSISCDGPFYTIFSVDDDKVIFE